MGTAQLDNMKPALDSYILNGKRYTQASLFDFAGSQLVGSATPQWEKEIFDVIRDWLDPSVSRIEAETSGSTGKPKRIYFTKASMAVSAQLTAKRFALSRGCKALLCLPARYIAGKMMIIRALVNGWELRYVEPSGNPLTQVNTPIDFAAMIPLQVHQGLSDTPKLFAKLGQVIIGGAPIPVGTMDMIQQTGATCFATYGMTETLTHIAVRRLNGLSRTELFEVLPTIQLSQDDRDCLVIEAPHLDGSIITNDLVELHGRGHFRWLGRYDNMINSGGVKISPEQVEKKLEHVIGPRFYLIGETDEVLGEKVMLVVEGERWTEEEQAAFMEKAENMLERFEVPKGIRFVEAFEETVTGKVRRKQ